MGNEAKGQKHEFLGIFLGTLVVSLLRNLFPGNGTKTERQRQGVIRAGEWIISSGHNF